jgi:hypothetical protein
MSKIESYEEFLDINKDRIRAGMNPLYSMSSKEVIPASYFNDMFMGKYHNTLRGEICDMIIEAFEAHKNNKKVCFPGEAGQQVVRYKKASTDFSIGEVPFEDKYAYLNPIILESLERCATDYMDRYNILKDKQLVVKYWYIQKYDASKGEAYFAPHTENFIAHKRVLAGMLYLNDIKDGTGGTHFQYQNKTLTPEQGTFYWWPAGYTHLHYGKKASVDKYILTTWLEFL